MPALQSRYLILIDIDGGAVDGDDLAIDVEFDPAFVGVPFVGAYVATGGVLPYTYTTSAGSLPAGLGPVDASTGIIPGTPTTPGYYEFTASVTDSATIPVTRSKAVAITVSAGINVSGRLAIGEVGIAYSSGVAASGGTPPYTWSTSGSLPPGLGPIDSTTGLIPGTPTLAGTYAFTIIATDSATFAQSYPVTITIVDAVDLSTSNYPDGIVGIAYSAGPTTLFGLGPFTYSLGSGAVPSGTTFYPSSGFVEGTPDTAATYNFDVDVVDSLGGTDTFSATVVVSISTGGGGSGTVTNFSAHDLSPLFTQSVSNPTTTPDLSFTQIAQAIHLVFAGPTTGSPANPTFRALVAADIPSLSYVSSVGVSSPITSTGGLTPTIGHATSGVSATTYGDSTHVAQVAVNATGHITSASNVAIAGFLPNASAVSLAGGTGEDGAALFDGTNTFSFATKSGNNYVLSRNVQLGTMQIATGCTLDGNGYKPFAQTWDCTTGFYGTFILSGNNGTSSVNTLGQPPGATRGAGGLYFGAGTSGTSGGNGGIGAASGVASGNTVNVSPAWGGQGGQGGRGGTSGANASPNAGTAGTALNYVPAGSMFAPVLTNSGGSFGGGSGGTGGSGGSSIAGGQAGGSGGGGGGAGCVDLSVGNIITDGSTPAGMLQAKGGNGGNGANGQAGNAGGGGGAAGGGGGGIRFIFGLLTGPSVTGFIDVSGGAGGNGGNALGTATDNAQGGPGGQSGRAIMVNISTGVWVNAVTRVSGSAATLKTGGPGGINTITLA